MAESPAPVATSYTLDFVRVHLPDGAKAVLEIGCGSGELARRLMDDGLEVVAIDSDQSCVDAAKKAGVDARKMDWPAKVDGRFEAVLFTRSLHHIEPLDEAVRAAVAAVRPGGRIIVEDFRAEGGTERSGAWFAKLLRDLHDQGKISDVDALIARIAPDGHGHVLHSSTAIAEALASVGTVQQWGAAYYFRYLEPELGEEATRDLLQDELAQIEAGAIDALGKRYIVQV